MSGSETGTTLREACAAICDRAAEANRRAAIEMGEALGDEAARKDERIISLWAAVHEAEELAAQIREVGAPDVGPAAPQATGEPVADSLEARQEERGETAQQRPPNRPGSNKPCFFVGSTGYDAECRSCGRYTSDFERKEITCPWDGIPMPDVEITSVASYQAKERKFEKEVEAYAEDNYEAGKRYGYELGVLDAAKRIALDEDPRYKNIMDFNSRTSYEVLNHIGEYLHLFTKETQAAPQATGEPVAWAYESRTSPLPDHWVAMAVCGPEGADLKPGPFVRNIEPLFKRAAPAASRIGVSEEEIARELMLLRGTPAELIDAHKRRVSYAWRDCLRDARAILALLAAPRAGGETEDGEAAR